ncbi:pentapeptide repeat-containing protein [Micromonospora purpureochromogenes]|uniref:pentapeptide repeat-containing protein n=1 Tax=Micromonospora purpureochromogenes TaxID=47872 RepID=UPI00362F05D8
MTAEQVLKAKNDVRTTLVQALAGLAVAGGLVVTYRTFRQNQAEQDRTYALRQAEQVNALYTKAVEQLGHDQAPVRLGALYSLVSLAQANPQQRQTVVDVLCAYLRMPYVQPTLNEETELAAARPRQEREVRLTAQRLLAEHLRLPSTPTVSDREAQSLPPTPDDPFWPGISLNLTGAALIDLNFDNISVVAAEFTKATFTGLTSFDSAILDGVTSFSGATFADNASFSWSVLSGAGYFNGATFDGTAAFSEATFNGIATFNDAIFARDAWFDHASFSGSAHFNGATFNGTVSFNAATFDGTATFNGTTFARSASGRTSFNGTASFNEARLLHLDDPDLNWVGDHRRVWPRGWRVRVDPDDPTSGTLVSEEQAESPAPTAPLSEPTVG